MAKIPNLGKLPTEVYSNSEFDFNVINNIRQAITQNQYLGHSRFYTKIEAMVVLRREPKPRGRPKKDNKPEENFNQRELLLFGAGKII